MPTKLFVGNIQCESSPETEDDLKRLFSKFGHVVECDILTGKSYGFVHMESHGDAKAAMQNLQGEEFYGGQLNIEMSDSQGSKGKKDGGRGGFRGGFRGGRGRGDHRGGGFRGGRGGFSRGRGGYGDRDRFDPYPRRPYDRMGRDPYAEALARLDRYRDSYDDPYMRDPYAARAAAAIADMYAMDRAMEAYGRGSYYDRRRDRAPVSYPPVRKGGRPGNYAPSSSGPPASSRSIPDTNLGPQRSSLYTPF